MDNDRSSARGWEQHPSTLTELKVASWPARAGFLFLCASALAMACGCDGAVQAAPRLKVLHSFAMQRGQTPLGDLIADASGNLYGTTEVGGADNDGIVFKLRPPAAGKTAWTEKVLHSFHGTDGANPSAALIADGAGNLYGTTGAGGKNFDGVVFELRAPAEGKTAWTESVLHTFEGSDGPGPYGGVIADRAGDLYGTTDLPLVDIDPEADPDTPEPREIERREMLDDAELLLEDLEAYGDWRSRPIGETVAKLCVALGLAPDSCVKRGDTWWVRRSPTAYEILREEKRAAGASP